MLHQSSGTGFDLGVIRSLMLIIPAASKRWDKLLSQINVNKGSQRQTKKL